jgi:dolichyl-phosphate-mannose--protein O-mannosyl transferase
MSIINIIVAAISHYMGSTFLTWIVTAVILIVAFICLCKLSATERTVKRVYRYAS